MNYKKTLSALKKSWCLESSSIYDKKNPSIGQCSVTAIVLQREFGGIILKTQTNGVWHYYNKINDEVYDFTSSQFSEKIQYQNITNSAEDALTDCTELQVAALTSKFKKFYK